MQVCEAVTASLAIGLFLFIGVVMPLGIIITMMLMARG